MKAGFNGNRKGAERKDPVNHSVLTPLISDGAITTRSHGPRTLIFTQILSQRATLPHRQGKR